MTDKIFIDSNIWIYAAMEDSNEKSVIAKKLIEKPSFVSTQVINEISVNLLRKYQYTESEIVSFVTNIGACCQIQQLTIQTCLNASSLREQYFLSFWDSLIVASALESGCATLYSEDMQHGLNIEQIRLVNPFVVEE